MELSEIFTKVMIDSGQFIISDTDAVIDKPRFLVLIKSCLGIYNNYCPVDKVIDIEANGTLYTFIDQIPLWISEVTPITNTVPAIANPLWHSVLDATGDQYKAEPKLSFFWKYRKPTLYLPYAGKFNIRGVFKHTVRREENINDPENPFYHIDTIDYEDEVLFRLILGKFLQGIGRSRRAFTLNDLPINQDAGDLVSEGNTIETDALTDLKENQSKFYLAML